MVWAATYKTKNKFADGLVLWQSKGDTYGEHRMFKHLTVILAFLMTLSSPVVAQDFQKGLAAATMLVTTLRPSRVDAFS